MSNFFAAQLQLLLAFQRHFRSGFLLAHIPVVSGGGGGGGNTADTLLLGVGNIYAHHRIARTLTTSTVI